MFYVIVWNEDNGKVLYECGPYSKEELDEAKHVQQSCRKTYQEHIKADLVERIPVGYE